jgi:hypothetical protein
MFHLFQTYVSEVLSCCNISRRRKQVHADAVPAFVALPACMRISRHEAGISRHKVGISRHEACTTACVGALACRGYFTGATVACETCRHRVACGVDGQPFFWKRLGGRDGRSKRGRCGRPDASSRRMSGR